MDPSEDPSDLASTVATRADFARFVRALLADWEASAAAEAQAPSAPWSAASGGWENPTLDRFLEALAAYADAQPLAEPPSWRSFAALLAAAKVYE